MHYTHNRFITHHHMTAAPTTKPEPATLDSVTADLAYATAQLEAWKAIRETAITNLQRLHAAGDAPTKFNAHGYQFALQTGKTSTTFDAHGKAAIDDLKAALIDQGHCETKVGDPFWVLRKAKANNA